MYILDDLLTEQDLQILLFFPKDWKADWVAQSGSGEVYRNASIVDIGASNRRGVDVPKQLVGIVDKLKRNPRDRLVRAYFNAMSAGTEPERHRDSNLRHSDDYTVVVYLTPNWKPSYGGETLEFTDLGFVSGAACKFGRAVSFLSSAVHQAREVSKHCELERVVAVFKYVAYSQAEQIMMARGWDTVKHRMGYTHTFLEHCLETANILKAYGATRDVIAAGMFHAAIGTEFFTPPNAMTFTELEMHLGLMAANLIATFSDHPRVWIKQHATKELKLIAAANEYDVETVKRLLLA